MKSATLHIDLDSIIYNYRHLKCYYKKNVIAVLKDDAYGVGLIEVYKALQYEEGLVIAVSDLLETKQLRDNNYKGDILYLNVFDESDVNFLKENNVTVIIDSLEQLQIVKDNKLKFHLKINTGMNRIGLSNKDIFKAIDLINGSKEYLITGIMTHFADEDSNHNSYHLFEKYVKLVNKKDLIIHCFASSSLNEYFDNISTHIRIGLKLFGITERSSFLHYALRLTSPILTIKKINKNEFVGYDKTYETGEKRIYAPNILVIKNNLSLVDVEQIMIREYEGNLIVQFIGSIDDSYTISILRDKVDSIYVNDNLIYGNKNIEVKLGEYRYKVSPRSFFQVNYDSALMLYDKIKQYLGEGNGRVLDLYCGTGTIGIYVSSNCHEVIGIEINESSVIDAKDNINNVRKDCYPHWRT